MLLKPLTLNTFTNSIIRNEQHVCGIIVDPYIQNEVDGDDDDDCPTIST